MNYNDRLEIAAQSVKEYNSNNPNKIEAIDDYTTTDLARISADLDIAQEDMSRMVGIMIYIRNRHVEKLSRVKSFQASFPERCIVTVVGGVVENAPAHMQTEKQAGDKLSASAIDIKAKRLENSQLYLKLYNLLQLNLYVSYAVDRMKVLDEALDKSLSPHVADRDKPQFMKIFLEETRKPENAKGMELNVNITNNDVSIVSVEDRMNTIAQAVNHATAGEIINMLQEGKELGKGDEE